MSRWRWDPVANRLVDQETADEIVPIQRAPLERNVSELLRALGVDDARTGINRVFAPSEISMGVQLGDPHQTLPEPQTPTLFSSRVTVPLFGFIGLIGIIPVRSELHLHFLKITPDSGGKIRVWLQRREDPIPYNPAFTVHDWTADGFVKHERPVLELLNPIRNATGFPPADVPEWDPEMLPALRRIPLGHSLWIAEDVASANPEVSLVVSEVRVL